MVLSDLDGPNLVITGNINEHVQSLEPSTTYEAKVAAFIGEEQVKEAQIIFSTNSPPFTYGNGGCSASPSQGFAFKTSFLVSCSQWHDPDLPLTYTFR